MLIVLSCLWLVLPTLATHQAYSANETGAYDSANSWLNLLVTNTFFEPYKLPFNQAIAAPITSNSTAQTNSSDSQLRLRLNPKSVPYGYSPFCRVNLRGDDAVVRKDAQAAITYYTKALSDMTTYSQCFKQYSNLRFGLPLNLAQLVNQLKKETYQDQDATPDSTKTDSETPSDEQLKQLENMQKNGQVNKQEQPGNRTLT